MIYSGDKLLYPRLSYIIVGLAYEVHNELGCYSREIQYQKALLKKLKTANINCCYEQVIKDSGNRADIVVENKIIIELKAKRFLDKKDYYQIQRYLQATKINLGLLINFQDRRLKPKRVLRTMKTKFANSNNS